MSATSADVTYGDADITLSAGKAVDYRMDITFGEADQFYLVDLQSQLAASGWPYRVQASVTAPPAAPANLSFHWVLQGGKPTIVVSWAPPTAGQPVPTDPAVTGSGCGTLQSSNAADARFTGVPDPPLRARPPRPCSTAPAARRRRPHPPGSEPGGASAPRAISARADQAPGDGAPRKGFPQVKTMTRLLNRNRAGRRGRRVAERAALALPAAGAAIAFAAPAFAATAWVITPTVNVNPSPPSNVFTAVDARTSTDAWVVGTYQNPVDDAGGTILAEHWNGTAWSAAPTPDIFRTDEKLNAVSAAAANDVWAVGSKQQTGFAHTDPLTAHWDGTSWSIVPTPDVRGGSKSSLFGVANLGGGNAWAVGRSETARTLIEHWDGSAWRIVPAPDPVVPAGMTLTSSSLSAISARSANDIWAVGSFSAAKGTQSNSFTLTMHWNGSAWKIVPSPNPGTPSAINGVRQTLSGVVEISPTDAWAVGNTFDTVSGSFAPDKPIAMHWNGTAWSLTTVPNQNGGGQLAAVTASSPTSVWAAGAADGTSVLHWNGTSWTPETIPSGPDGPRIMTGISAVRGSATEVWGAAGTFVAHHP